MIENEPAAHNPEALQELTKRIEQERPVDPIDEQTGLLQSEPWQKAVDLIVDSITHRLGTPDRREKEKRALAETSLAVINKHLHVAKSQEEVALAVVVLPIGLSILLDYWKKADKPDAQDATGQPAHSDPGSNGQGEVSRG